jgi:hypothetical protein
MRGGCVIGMCVATLGAGCSGSSSATAPTELTATAVSLASISRASSVTPETVQSSHAAALVPFKGSLEGEYGDRSGDYPIFHNSITGKGNATHLGRYTLAIEEIVNVEERSATGSFILTAANRDMVSGTFIGHAQGSGPLFSITEEATITAGTGRFVGATGSFVIDRVFDSATGKTTGSFEGSISSTGAGSH